MEKCGITPHCFYRDSLTLISAMLNLKAAKWINAAVSNLNISCKTFLKIIECKVVSDTGSNGYWESYLRFFLVECGMTS